MSNPRHRKADRYGRQDILKILLELDRLQRAVNERRVADVRAERAAALRAWFCRHLAETQPAPGQRPDTRLGNYIGDLNLVGKRSRMAALSLPVTSLRPLSDGGWLLEAKGTLGTGLKRAFRKLRKRALGQMGDHGQRPAGAIVDSTIDDAGNASISARVDDAPAIQKLRANVYPLVEVKHAGDQILSVDLVDTDALSKSANNRQVILHSMKVIA
jgi:hypothetical protein